MVLVPFCICILLLGAIKETLQKNDSLPEHLVECYASKIILLPMTTRSLIEIIRKIEMNRDYWMDIRMLTGAIMTRFWRDGIERDPNVIIPSEYVIPYRMTGFQSYKYKLLYSRLISNPRIPFPNDTLTLEERCTLHFMLSSSIDVWERGDESTVCPYTSEQKQIYSHEKSGAKMSSCPIEKGVISDKDSISVSLNHVFGGIVSALQPMDVAQERLVPNIGNILGHNQVKFYNRTVNNILASTLTGDIAEVIVFQLPISQTSYFGPPNFWNDTKLPVVSYLKADYDTILYQNWQFTNAEIVGAVDGLSLAEEVVRYKKYFNFPKLSQLLEMYYENHGRNIPMHTRACNRRSYFSNDVVKKGIEVADQTLRFAEVLAAWSPRYFTDKLFIEVMLGKVFRDFNIYAKQLFSEIKTSCHTDDEFHPKINLFVIFDSTWSDYETISVLMHISKQIDVSHYGSNLTAINGVRGTIIVDSATSTNEVYLSWKKSKTISKVVDSTDLHKGFLTVKYLIERDGVSKLPVGHVTLVFAASTPISDHSFDSMSSTVRSIKNLNPDMKFIYVTSTTNSGTFGKLTSLPFCETDNIITLHDKNKNNLYEDLKILNEVPRSLQPNECRNETWDFKDFETEQYVSPGKYQSYKIHPIFLCSASNTVHINITNNNYGALLVCISRNQNGPVEHTKCHSAELFEEIRFTVFSPCISKIVTNSQENSDNDCKPIFLKVIPKRSCNRCTENDCRFPDDIRISISISGLKCINYPMICDTAAQTIPLFLCILISVIILLFMN